LYQLSTIGNELGVHATLYVTNFLPLVGTYLLTYDSAGIVVPSPTILVIGFVSMFNQPLRSIPYVIVPLGVVIPTELLNTIVYCVTPLTNAVVTGCATVMFVAVIPVPVTKSPTSISPATALTTNVLDPEFQLTTVLDCAIFNGMV
jgi:hypothetical protein